MTNGNTVHSHRLVELRAINFLHKLKADQHNQSARREYYSRENLHMLIAHVGHVHALEHLGTYVH